MRNVIEVGSKKIHVFLVQFQIGAFWSSVPWLKISIWRGLHSDSKELHSDTQRLLMQKSASEMCNFAKMHQMHQNTPNVPKCTQMHQLHPRYTNSFRQNAPNVPKWAVLYICDKSKGDLCKSEQVQGGKKLTIQLSGFSSKGRAVSRQLSWNLLGTVIGDFKGWVGDIWP